MTTQPVIKSSQQGGEKPQIRRIHQRRHSQQILFCSFFRVSCRARRDHISFPIHGCTRSHDSVMPKLDDVI